MSRVWGTKTTKKSTFFKMGGSLVDQFGREILYGQVTDGGELGNNGYYN